MIAWLNELRLLRWNYKPDKSKGQYLNWDWWFVIEENGRKVFYFKKTNTTHNQSGFMKSFRRDLVGDDHYKLSNKDLAEFYITRLNPAAYIGQVVEGNG